MESSQPLLQHLNELRQRLFKAFIAVIITTALSFIFAQQMIDYLATPIGGRGALVSIEITENMAIFMRVALLGGIILGMPVIVYQLMRFLLPGLKKREKLWLILGVPLATLLFVAGDSIYLVCNDPLSRTIPGKFFGYPYTSSAIQLFSIYYQPDVLDWFVL